MEKDVLVILMIAFGIFAVVMFVLFYAYLKKYYNSRHIRDDYKKDLDEEVEDDDSIGSFEDKTMDEEFIPKKKE